MEHLDLREDCYSLMRIFQCLHRVIFIAKKKKIPQAAVWDGGWADAADDGGRTIVVDVEVMRSSVACDAF